MNFPLSMDDLGLWLAIMAIILLITSELLYSSSSFFDYIAIDKTTLRKLALMLGAGFMVIVFLRSF